MSAKDAPTQSTIQAKVVRISRAGHMVYVCIECADSAHAIDVNDLLLTQNETDVIAVSIDTRVADLAE